MLNPWCTSLLLLSCVFFSEGKSAFETGGIVPVKEFEGRSYYFSYNFKANFYVANQMCEELGMRLVTVPSKEVNDFLYQEINSANKDIRFWTSGTNLVDGRTWVWISTAQPIDYTNWMRGQPDNVGERCIELWLSKNVNLGWNNLDCNVLLNFICESPDFNEKLEVIGSRWPSAMASPSLSPNFPIFNYNKNSYYVGNVVPLTYLDAGRFCSLIGMELVSIKSEGENHAIYKYIRDTIAGVTFWSGGSRLIDGTNWYWLPSGHKVEYTSWLKAQPDSKVEHCIQLQFQKDVGLFWNDLSCAVSQNFICKAPTKSIAKCQESSCEKADTTCSSPMVPYYHIGTEKVTYREAIKKCENLGLKLVSIQNKAKQDSINNLLQPSDYTGSMWTSGNKITDKTTWRWLNGETFTETFWNTGEPNNAQKDEECVAIFKKDTNSVWNDAPCDYTYGYICERVSDTCQNQCYLPPTVNVFIENNKQKYVY